MRRYGGWAGRPNGLPENVAWCVVSVPEGGRSPLFHQCYRKRGHGPDGLYCKQHAHLLAAGRHLWVPDDDNA